MKTAFKTMFLVGLSGLQFLCGAQAQSSAAASTGPSSTQTPAPAPTQPSFINTPGLIVTSPFDGMIVSQNTVLSISASLANQLTIGSIHISVARKDGSSNTTIVDLNTAAGLRTNQIWNITAAQYPVDDYLMNMIVKSSSDSNTPVVATSAAAAAPTSSPQAPVPGPSGPSSVFYWQGKIKVAAPRSTNEPISAASGMRYESLNSRGLGMATMLVAAGIAFFGSLLVL